MCRYLLHKVDEKRSFERQIYVFQPVQHKAGIFDRSHCYTGQNKSHLDTDKETEPKVFSKSNF